MKYKLELEHTNIHLDENIENVDFLVKTVNRAYRKNVLFFNQELNNKLNLKLIYSREDFPIRYSPYWMIGFEGSEDSSEFYVFSPEVFEKVSLFNGEIYHKKDSFPKIVCHEMTHKFQQLGVKKYGSAPRWLSEGIACYVAEQTDPELIFNMPDVFSIDDLTNNWFGINSRGGYNQASSIIYYVSKNFGEKKVLELYLESNISENDKDLAFKKVLGLKRESLLNDWTDFYKKRKSKK